MSTTPGRIIVKFGGSNMREREDIARIVRIVRAYGRPLVIVVSALYGITNKLISALRDSLQDEAMIRSFSDMILDLKTDILDHFVQSEALRRDVQERLEGRLLRLERYLHGIHYLGEIPPSVEDTVVSYGERLSSLLLSTVLSAQGLESREGLPEDIGLVTDGEYGNATIDFARSIPSVRRALACGTTWVVPGFYGVSTAGKVTVFGRGGSDYTAAGLARCLDAASVDVWKDVQGFRTADPGIVTGTRRVEALTYREAAELSYFGARILHPRTVEPLEDQGIPVRIMDVEGFGERIEPASVVGGADTARAGVVRSVTYSDDVAVLKLRGPGVGVKPGILAGLTTALDNNGVNIKSIITAQTSINLLVARGSLEKSHDLLKGMDFGVVREVVAVSDVSLVAVVGEGLPARLDLLSSVWSALERASIPVVLSATGASEVAAYYIVAQEYRARALQAIHDVLFSP